MKLLNKIFELKIQKPINSEDIELHIISQGYEPLRWAIVKANNDIITIESTLIESEK
jgi:hypothetical protein